MSRSILTNLHTPMRHGVLDVDITFVLVTFLALMKGIDIPPPSIKIAGAKCIVFFPKNF